jgi:hypothetical protein
MNRSWLPFSLLLFPLVLGPRAVHAQDSMPSPGTALQGDVPHRRLVRISVEQARVMGRLTGLTAGQLTLQTNAGPRRIDLSAIDSVWVRRNNAGLGALVGALALAVAGSVGGAALCGGLECDPGTGALALGAVGLGAGALIGAGIGALVPRWKRRVP